MTQAKALIGKSGIQNASIGTLSSMETDQESLHEAMLGFSTLFQKNVNHDEFLSSHCGEWCVLRHSSKSEYDRPRRCLRCTGYFLNNPMVEETMKLLRTIKGLYWFFYYSKRIIVPFNKEAWDTLWSIGHSWSNGAPEPIQYGQCLRLYDSANRLSDLLVVALERLDDSYHRTCNRLASFNMFPVRERQLIKTYNQDCLSTNIGWKATFEWRPTW